MRILTLLCIVLLVGCHKYPTYDSKWSSKELEIWVQKSRTICKHKGYAMDTSRGIYSMNEILECPDGTLRIVPTD